MRLKADIKQEYEATYQKRTPKSREAYRRAKNFLPGGEARPSAFFWPYPIWVDRASGCRFTDVDGNEYVDFHNCNTVMVLGHAHPNVVQAVGEQIAKGSVYGALHHLVIRWAETICTRVPSIDKIRFGNSGTEAVMSGIKLARAFTGRDLILKMEGGFYGTYDPVFSPSDAPGLPKSVLGDSLTIPFNDEEAAERAISENKHRLAAVIVEGIVGRSGQIPPNDGYLDFLRDATRANGVLLLFDEIQSFRVDYGGVQGALGIEPDLTMLGKIIGGGLPVGAVGGREDIMALASPESRSVYVSGTFTGNALTAAAGIATLDEFGTNEIERINELGRTLATGLREVFARLKVKGQVTGWGSLQNVHFSPTAVEDGKSALDRRKTYHDLLHLFHLGLMERGIFSTETGLFNISTPMTEAEIAMAARAVDSVLTDMRPYIEREYPELVN